MTSSRIYGYPTRDEVSTDSFLLLLCRWRGSLYKLVWKEVLFYIIVYSGLTCTYRFALNEDQKRLFEALVLHCSRFRDLLPVAFILGFYVTLVVVRWWGAYFALPHHTSATLLIAANISGGPSERQSLEIRRQLVRYVNLTIVMTFSVISPVVRKKYPDYQTLVDDGYLKNSEMQVLERLDEQNQEYLMWVPMTWASRATEEARVDGFIQTDHERDRLIEELLKIRAECDNLLGWREYNIPVVYTQVVTLAVYTYYVFSVLSEQFLDPEQNYPEYEADYVIPVHALMKLLFYIGWLKVAQSLHTPFGDDDSHFRLLDMLKTTQRGSYGLTHILAEDFAQEAEWQPAFLQLTGREGTEPLKVESVETEPVETEPVETDPLAL